MWYEDDINENMLADARAMNETISEETAPIINRQLRRERKKGFKIEGILNEAVFRNGKYMDLISMRLLKSEFDKTKKK